MNLLYHSKTPSEKHVRSAMFFLFYIKLIAGVILLGCQTVATNQTIKPRQITGEFQKAWVVDFKPDTSSQKAQTWLKLNLAQFCKPGPDPSSIKAVTKHVTKEVQSKLTQTSWPEPVLELSFACPSDEEYQAFQQNVVKQNLEEFQNKCASDKTMCIEVARAHVFLKADIRTIIDDYIRVCPLDADPIDGACLEAGLWANKALLPDVARAFFIRGCVANEGNSCGELAILDFKTKHPEADRTSHVAIEMLTEECNATVQDSCTYLSRVIANCPKSNKTCKKASLYLTKKSSEERRIAEERKLQSKSIDAANRQAAASESAAEAARDAAHSARMLQLSNSLSQSLNNAYGSIKSTYSTTSCTSRTIGSTTYTDCK
jgi:hypothetical protein